MDVANSLNSSGAPQGAEMPTDSRIPLLNRWDVYPIVGTLIGIGRIIYGIFAVAVGFLISLCCCCRKEVDLISSGYYHLARGAQSLISFLPFISARMREADRNVFGGALPNSGGNNGSSSQTQSPAPTAGGNGLSSAPTGSQKEQTRMNTAVGPANMDTNFD